MPDLIKIETTDGLTEDQFNADPGRHIGLLVTVSGTNQTGQTGGFADIGRFVVTRGGRPLINRNAKKFADINDVRSGKAILDSITAGAFEAGFFIPFFEKGHPNALNIRGDKELNIRFIPADDGTVFSDLEVTVESKIVNEIKEQYEFTILAEDQSPASAATNKAARLNTPNVSSIFIEDVDDIISQLQFESNGRVVTSNNDFFSLRVDTVMNNRIEDDTFAVVEIQNHTPGVKVRNNKNMLRYSTTGAGDFDVTVCAMIWPGQGN